MSKIYTLTVDASFSFDVDAESPEDAERIARERLKRWPVLDDAAMVNNAPFPAPWIAIAGEDMNYPSLEVTDAYPEH